MTDATLNRRRTPGPEGADGRSWLAGPFGKWFASPPRVWQVAIVGAICAFAVYATSFPFGLTQFVIVTSIPGFLSRACLIWPGGVVLLGIDHIVRAVVCMSTRRFDARNWRWYVATCLFVAIIVAWRTDWLLRWRFSVNRPALEEAVASLLQAAKSAPVDEEHDVQWPLSAFNWYHGQPVGDYSVSQVAVFPGQRVANLTTGGFLRSGWGFLYDPDGRVNTPYFRLSPLGDGWFVFAYSKE